MTSVVPQELWTAPGESRLLWRHMEESPRRPTLEGPLQVAYDRATDDIQLFNPLGAAILHFLAQSPCSVTELTEQLCAYFSAELREEQITPFLFRLEMTGMAERVMPPGE